MIRRRSLIFFFFFYMFIAYSCASDDDGGEGERDNAVDEDGGGAGTALTSGQHTRARTISPGRRDGHSDRSGSRARFGGRGRQRYTRTADAVEYRY